MSHYIVAQLDILDPEGYKKYEAGFMAVFEQYEGKLLAVDEDHRLLEGSWPYTRTVIIEFPSEEASLNWYQSDAYQALAQHRFAASNANISIIKGLS